MRAAIVEKWGGVDCLKIAAVPEPKSDPNRVIVRLKVSGLNHLDIWVRRGMPFLNLSLPHVLGGDGAGVVDSVGTAVKSCHSWNIGDEVIVHPGLSCGHCEHCLQGIESLCRGYKILGEHVWGTNAEFVSVPAENLFRKPEKLSWESAGTFGLVTTTAWQMIQKANLKSGQVVLVHAAGSGVSVALTQFARNLGARVFATGGSSKKLDLARQLGAEKAWLYADLKMSEEIRSLTESQGVDVIFDHVGADVFEKNIRLLKWGGKLVTCGATSGYLAQLDIRHIFYKQLQIIGSTMGSKRDFPQILGMIESGKVSIPVWKTYALNEIQKAHEAIEKRQAEGKIGLLIY